MALYPRPYPDDNSDDSWLRTHHQQNTAFSSGWRYHQSADWETPYRADGHHHHHHHHHYGAGNGRAELLASALPSSALDYDLSGLHPSDYGEGVALPSIHRTISPFALHPDRSFVRLDDEHLPGIRSLQEAHESIPYMPQGYSPDSSRHSSWSNASGQRETSPMDTNISSISSCPPSTSPIIHMGNSYAGIGVRHAPSLGGDSWSITQHQGSQINRTLSQNPSSQQNMQMEDCITMKDIQFSPDPSHMDDHTFDGDDTVSPARSHHTLDDLAGSAAIDPDLDAEGEPDDDYNNEMLSDHLNVPEYPDSDVNDPDFNPSSSSRRAAPRRAQAPRTTRNNRPITFPGSTVAGRISKSSGSTGRAGNRGKKVKSSIEGKSDEVVNKAIAQSKNPQPFTCPMTPYGCRQTFTTKNEWKRHITSLHLFTELWRCDLCPDMASRPNDFNRKDLFVQHLRRMHFRDNQSSDTNRTTKKGGSIAKRGKQRVTAEPTPTESSARVGPPADELERITQRCWHRLRKEPDQTECAFCRRQFEGKSSLEEWLEHVARHLSDSAGQRQPPLASFSGMNEDMSVNCDVEKWANDEILLEWLIRNKLVERNSTQQWVMKEKEAILTDAQRFLADEAQADRRHSLHNGEPGLDDEDAIGDEEEEDSV